MYFDETNNFFDIISNEKEFEIDKYVDKSKLYNTNVNIDSINFNRDVTLNNPIEGFNKGNMFNNLYSKYKNHVYTLKVNNPRDELLYKIQMCNFAIRDYGLYLDIYPTDKKVLSEFQKCKKMLKELKTKYEKEYSPLCVNDVTSDLKWTWINNPWPWDKGGNI